MEKECDCIKGYTGLLFKAEVIVCGKCGNTAKEAALKKVISDMEDKLHLTELDAEYWKKMYEKKEKTT